MVEQLGFSGELEIFNLLMENNTILIDRKSKDIDRNSWKKFIDEVSGLLLLRL